MTAQISLQQIARMRGKGVRSSDGRTLGRIEAVYYDGLKKEPFWVEVKSGFLIKERHYLVPLEGASLDAERLTVAFVQAMVRESPGFDTWKGLTEDVERAANQHFGTYQPQHLRVMQVVREGDLASGLNV